ncbi:hypothetical protein GGC64_006334 [Mycobacterium sp. OAS707]|uniref:anthrone oxygenase family protein n=1 Tax=Mycobacterium sp. OAS707 TaxID=2663822 RepID=UPI001789B9F2|nr:anthrone oxygenase family protein [Mycobacterium sp. OAS707]MBE1552247.1 hypothetical protein [Mycobacterium sp. OAS707]
MTEDGTEFPTTAAIARFGRAAWFFGNAYEAAVGVPELIASADRQDGILGVGSPVRYFAPIGPAAVGGTAAVLARSWRNGGDRRKITAASATLGAALGVSAYLIASINVPLLRGKTAKEQRGQLISRWHWGNCVRLGLLAATEILVRRVEVSAQSAPRPQP